MRLAAIQVDVQPGRRAANLRAVLAALESAAEMDPAPELCVLPAMFDLAPMPRGADAAVGVEALYGPTTAALAAAARELGVNLAFALAARDGDEEFAAGVLLDVDGDVRLIQRQVAQSADDPPRRIRGLAIAAASIPLTRAAILVRDDLLSAEAWRQAQADGARLVLGCAALPETAHADPIDQIAAHAGRAGVWAVVANAGCPDQARVDGRATPGGAKTERGAATGRTCIIAPDGRVVARGPARGEHVCLIRTSRVHPSAAAGGAG